ncbi:hypothetical protein [Actinomadura montaniterrae]|uniref:Uncharacterized protein n=1 Tax=Actinomadura montaniterrae TaxID=1803903 RepID=A0A6L3VE22_9ACTN|nr:hypothetical protein [Actinomadura montaniterrae]KAB2353283.1 hypothetical protein F9B16_49660 [Actinomadura montaniterrae]
MSNSEGTIVVDPRQSTATGEVQRALHALEEQTQVAWSTVSGVDGLALAEAGKTVERVTDALDPMWTIVGMAIEAIEQVRRREVSEGLTGQNLEALDTALVHLAYGHEGLGVARHLLGIGRGELLRMQRGELKTRAHADKCGWAPWDWSRH